MDLYIIKHNYITSDHDGWKQWMVTDVVAYRSTMEKAKIKLDEILKERGLTEETNANLIDEDGDTCNHYDICYEYVD